VGHRVDVAQRHHALRQHPQGPARPPVRRRAAGQSDQPRFGLTVQFARIEPWRRTGAQRRLHPLFDKALANPLDGRHAHPHRLGNRGVDFARPSHALIGVKQDTSMG
jgi:hypothetical protein